MAIAVNPKSRMKPLGVTRKQIRKGTYSSKHDDDNMYLLTSGKRPLSGDWNAGPHKITAGALAVQSTTKASSFKMVYNDTEDCLDFLFIES